MVARQPARTLAALALPLALLALLAQQAGAKGRKSKRTAASDDSGWRAGELPPPLVAGCDASIDVVDAADLTSETFHNEYLGKARPLLIRGAINGWRAHRRWRRSSFVKHYGHHRVQTGNATDLVLFNGGWHFHTRQRDSLAGFVKSFAEEPPPLEAEAGLDKPFIFEANELLGASAEMRADFATPSALKPAFSTAEEGRDRSAGNMWSVFSLGEGHAGLPFHSHGASWLGLVHGAKHWFMYPPGEFSPSDRAMTSPLAGVKGLYFK